MPWPRHLLGLATLLTVIAGGSYLWSLLGEADPDSGYRLTLAFDDAQGLREGSGLRYRGVRVGEVHTIEFGPDHREVRIHCVLTEAASNTVRETTRFWIVRPEFRGLVEGASGLDTLIKDPYLVYETPVAEGPTLPSGSRVRGLDRPPDRPIVGIERGARPGDLQFTVLFAENRGLTAGAKVLYRGQPVGKVTSVSLTPTGSSVDVRAVVAKSFRYTVRRGTRFWIARPTMSVAWTSGLQVHDIERLLGGAALSYAPPISRAAPPATDDSFFVGLDERPEIEWSDLEGQTEALPLPGSLGDERFGGALARIHYRFVETDFWSPNDEHRFESLGVVMVTADGVPVAIVARSAIDGQKLVDDAIGEPDIAEESWHVRLSDGSVHAAARIWMTDGSDLALLRLDPRSASAVGSVEDVVAYPESTAIPAAIEVIGLNDDGQLVRSPGTLDGTGELRGPASRVSRGVLVSEGRLIGISSTATGSSRATLFAELPNTLRSAKR